MFYKYVKKLEFEEKPDYCYLKELFYRRLVMEGSDLDNVYDWVLNPKFLRKPIPLQTLPLTFKILPREEEFVKNIENTWNITTILRNQNKQETEI